MSKKHALDDGEPKRSNKRLKLAAGQGLPDQAPAQHLSGDDIRRLLTFSQDARQQVRENYRTVRIFLERTLEHVDEENASSSLQSVSHYLSSTTPTEINEGSLAIPDVVQTWSLALRIGNKDLAAAATSLIALILKVISANLSFRRQGAAICQTLLLEDQVKSIEAGLAHGNGKEQLSSSCLHLLTEMVSFDGGVFSRAVYRHRGSLLPRIDDFLTLKGKHSENKRNKHSIALRRNALKLVLAVLRVQDSDVKAELLADHRRSRVLFQFLNEDRPADIVATLHTLDVSFLSDPRITRSSKSRVVSENALSKVLSLCRYAVNEAAPSVDVRKAAHDFLLKILTTPERGVLVSQNGWYPSGLGAPEDDKIVSTSQFRSSRGFVWQAYTERVPVRNTKLAVFLHELRPFKDIEHRKLVLGAFKAAPELVADYFMRQKSFSFDPKLTATWIGYAGFLIAVGTLEPPKIEPGSGLPPPSIVVENLLPSATSSKLFSKCLLQSPSLVSLISAKILIACFEKLGKIATVAQRLSTASGAADWYQAVVKGLEERCPSLQIVTAAVRNCSNELPQLKEALLKLVSLYFRLAPPLCLTANLEVSVMLAEAMVASDDKSSNAEMSYLTLEKLSMMYLDHLLQVASTSSSEFDWYRKPERLQFSPFTTILRLVLRTQDFDLQQMVQQLTNRHFLLQTKTSPRAWYLFVETLRPFVERSAIFRLLDNCVIRFTQRSVKYEGDMAGVAEGPDLSQPISLLLFVVMDQWPHFNTSSTPEDVVSTATWLRNWLCGSWQIGESKSKLLTVKSRLIETTLNEEAIKILDVPWESIDTGIAELLVQQSNENMPVDDTNGTAIRLLDDITTTYNEQLKLEPAPADFPELFKWSRKEVLDAVEDGDVSALVLCLCAAEQSARAQAQTQLKLLAARVKESLYGEKQQMYLLLMEIIETSVQWGVNIPLPSFTGVFASQCVAILNDPTHHMYPKINKLLIRGPEWDAEHLPSYWRDKVFAKPPSKDDGLAGEANWLAQLYLEGLQTPKDLDLYRRRQVFETLMLRYDAFPASFGVKVLRLLWRSSLIEGGSSTLTTRCGLIAWCRERDTDPRVQALHRRILASCDQTKLKEWGTEIL